MDSLACAVTGHRDIPLQKIQPLCRALDEQVRFAFDDGFRVFWSGFAEGADTIFAKRVLALQKEGLPILLCAAIPYQGRVRELERTAEGRFLLESCSRTHIVSPVFFHGVHHVRDRFLAEECARMIAVYDGRSTGGTLYTLLQARERLRDVRTINLAEL